MALSFARRRIRRKRGDWMARRSRFCRTAQQAMHAGLGGTAATNLPGRATAIPLPRGWEFTGQAIFCVGKKDCAARDWATVPLLYGLSKQDWRLVWWTRRAGIEGRVVAVPQGISVACHYWLAVGALWVGQAVACCLLCGFCW